MSFNMIKEAQARLALGNKLSVAEHVQKVLGDVTLSEVKSIVESFNKADFQITPEDYSRWLEVVVELMQQHGGSRKRDFMDIALDVVLDNDPKFDLLGGDQEALKAQVANTLWQTYKASKAHSEVAGNVNSTIQQAREEEEAIADLMSVCDDNEREEEESGGGFEQALKTTMNIDSAQEEEHDGNPYPVGTMRHALWKDVNKSKMFKSGHNIVKKAKEEEEFDDIELDDDIDIDTTQMSAEDLASRIVGKAGIDDYETSDTGDQTDVEARIEDLEARIKELECDADADTEEIDSDTLDIDYDSLGNDRPGAAQVIGVSIPASGKEDERFRDKPDFDDEESTKKFFRTALTSPKEMMSQAIKDIEAEGAEAWKKLQFPKNPHPKKSQAFRAWEKGMKNAAKDHLGFKDKPVQITSKPARKK